MDGYGYGYDLRWVIIGVVIGQLDTSGMEGWEEHPW
jgi:hypothetical protein